MGGTNLKTKGANGIHIQGSNGALISAGANNFNAIYGSLWDGTEADTSITAPHSGRILRIIAKATVNSITNDITVSLRIGGVTQPGGAVITGLTDEEVESTTVAEFSKGDVINMIAASASGGTTAGLHHAVEIEWDND